ncbi:MAG: Cof-type HAD-IIB family hydrolase [Clostridium sp.]|nr:Cof-type HAD-IIB family hydrolase [Clostridium sp.]
MAGKLIFFDVDGTLVQFDGTMPPSAGEALRRARKNGHRLVLCTGRSKYQIYPWLLEFGFDGIVAAAGAYVEWQGRCISHKTASGRALHRFVDFFERERIPYCLQTAQSTIVTDENAQKIMRLFAEKFSVSEEQVRQVFGDVTRDAEPEGHRDIEKMIYYDSPYSVGEVAAALTPWFDVTVTSFADADETSGEVTLAGVTKSYGMRKLMEHAACAQLDTIAFGDGFNDLDMLQFAGTGVAMGNAAEKVRSAADRVTARVDEDGIWCALHDMALI